MAVSLLLLLLIRLLIDPCKCVRWSPSDHAAVKCCFLFGGSSSFQVCECRSSFVFSGAMSVLFTDRIVLLMKLKII